MATKVSPAKNILEQAEKIASDAWGKTEEIAEDTAKTVAQDVSSEISFSAWLGLGETLPPEVVKAKEDEDLMRKTEGYKDIFRKIDAIEGKATDEKALDEKVRKYIEEEKKRTAESFREMKTEHKAEAEGLSTPPQGEEQKEQAEQQKEAAKEEEEESKKTEQQQGLDTPIETPPGPQAGAGFKGKRKSNPRRGTPRATAQLRSADTRTARE